MNATHTYDCTRRGYYNFDFNNTNFLNETNGTAVQGAIKSTKMVLL